MALRTTKVLAPLGGWNTRDPVSAMKPTDAIAMTNLIPDVDGVRIRPGYAQHLELIASGGWVNTLLSWHTEYGEKFIAASHLGSDHRIFDISAGTVSTLKTGLSGSKWRSGAMNGFLGMVNGVDGAQKLSYSPGSGMVIQSLAFSGPSASTIFKVIHIHKSRSYFATGDEAGFWYSEVNALGGTLTYFPIDRVALSSGNVIEIRSWSRDGGTGPTDYIVLFLDSGEVLVYDGSNPGDANDWAIVSRYKLGKVLATFPFGGKIHVVTDADYSLFPDDLLTEGLTRPSKLSGAARDAVKRDGSDNWQVFVDPVNGWQIVNVPYGSSREQHVLNFRSGGATRLTYPANVWARFQGDLYFGSNNGKVYKVREGDDDGVAVSWSVQQAYSDFRIPQNKFVRNYRPFWTTDGDFTGSSGLAYDYKLNYEFTQSQGTSALGATWDVSSWDTSPWAVSETPMMEWLLGSGFGQNVSMLQYGSTSKKAIWHHTDYRLEVASDTL